MTLISKKHINRYYYYLFIALAFVMPLHFRLTAPVILLIGFNWIGELNFREKVQRIRDSKLRQLMLGFSLLYLVYLLSAFYSTGFPDNPAAWFQLQIKLSLLLFPVFGATIDFNQLKRGWLNMVKKAFVIGCFVSVVFLLNLAMFEYMQEKTTTVFFYTKLSALHHPSYLSMYYSMAILLLLDWWIRRTGNTFKRILVAGLSMIFLLFIVLLSSKTGILGMAFVLAALLIYFLIFMRGRFKKIVWVVPFLLIFLIGTIWNTPHALKRFYNMNQAVNQETTKADTTSSESTLARMHIWKSSLELVKKHPVFGIGVGDVKPALLNMYEENGITVALEKELNTHNQFLQITLASGIFGLLILLLALIVPAAVSIVKREYLYFLFLLLFSFHLLTEAMLERQAGIIFYAFFNMVLFYDAYISSSQIRASELS